MTPDDEFSDEKVLEAWNENADPWTDAVRERKIESRNLATDKAVLETIISLNPQSVLDLGCGEGWLSREMSSRGMKVLGVDAVPELIERAQGMGGAQFKIASYEDIAGGAFAVNVDLVVANFSLIGKDAVDAVVKKAASMLNPGGSLVIQTPHPVIAGEDEPYRDGWRPGSWAGCGASFSKAAAPWYFRTIGTWVRLLRQSGLYISEIREPLHPATGKPASLILVASRA
jgi:2-polyprenyl-3-methyl-5-hydroxy-6-metoxy-1,4-benzoquinol methylase